jgi:hypothetical protein
MSEFSWNPPSQFESQRLKRFYSLEDGIKSAYLAGQDDQVRTLSTEYLDLATTYRCNWNYGNAVHDANRYLGLVSLRHDSVKEAAAFLLAAGNTPGSPQLDSFGPELDLADQLLKRGQTGPVKEYLTDIKVFWKGGDRVVDRWLAAIARGERPTLDRFSAITTGPWIAIAEYFGWVWPELIVLSFLYLARRRLARKLLFVVAGSVVAFGAMYLVDWALGFVTGALASHAASTSGAVSFLSFSILSGLVVLAAPILAVYVLSRSFLAHNLGAH